jgi:hypothetical protein
MAEPATVVRNMCRTLNAEVQAPTCDLVTTPSAWPRRTLDLIQKIRP